MSEALRVVVADDEAVARKRLARLLSAIPGVEVVGECASGDEVLARLDELSPDVLLLDVRMPGLSGLETKALLREDGAPYVIFATAHPEHAVDAFDVGASDYVLKPIEAARLSRAIERARKALGERDARRGVLDRVALATRKGVRLLDPATITHATFDGALVTVHLAGEALLSDTSLQELEDKLPEDSFARVHRRALLNLRRVAHLQPLDTGGYVAVTDAGARVEVSRQAARRLRRLLGIR